jgi:hypothetical protein
MVSKPTGNPRGRPCIYTPELAEHVCNAIATSPHGLRKIAARDERFPNVSTIYEWIAKVPGFSEQYLESRRLQATVLADYMLDITGEIPIHEDKDGNDKIDAGMLGKAKLDFEILRWHASKMAPKIYGDAKQVEDLTADRDRLKQELQELKEKLDAKNKKDF